MAKPQETEAGRAVDPTGGPVVDPTANVLALVQAANRRQDDLRESNNRRIDAELQCGKEIAALREQYAERIRMLETDRLNAIRQIDALAARTDADRVLAAVQTLAATTSSTAESLRNSTGGTIASINERISALEKSSYTGEGKGAGSDAVKAANRATVMGVIAIISVLATLVFNLLGSGAP